MPLDTKAPEPKWVVDEPYIGIAPDGTTPFRKGHWLCPEGWHSVLIGQHSNSGNWEQTLCVSDDPKGSDQRGPRGWGSGSRTVNPYDERA